MLVYQKKTQYYNEKKMELSICGNNLCGSQFDFTA